MNQYYSERAKEYENVYYREDPIRQQEQSAIQTKMKQLFNSKDTLEIACGTGYWSQFVYQEVQHLTAMDASLEVLDMAKAKNLPANKVTFLQGDAFQLDTIPGQFEAAYANFWFSHIPKDRIDDFLQQFHLKLQIGSPVFMADNIFIPSIGGTLMEKEDDENTYKRRTLQDGSEYEVIKNYYNADELHDLFERYAYDIDIHFGQCFWWISYKVKSH
ncbi:class I SAM-dependent methyltransferase [Gracilibacillus alcaliphilus]|uniref:class I SAM-dependent methyltransferase n=1 Tax=Gracilibacillus alcaliphilus TaxID=1401441 RepID=UPI001957CA05|nr:class I SAM-dependent methyltransferase [Gracilibacillus alcaliphilus]MBM7676864.1 SAM-dependent methyltransferase [Gracilibacillus alcaliphilus]